MALADTSCGISPSVLPSGTVGSAYSATLQAGGGTGPYTWMLTGGALPAGLGLDSTTGVISGTPDTAQAYSFTVRADDSAQHYCTMPISITINPAASDPNLSTVTTIMLSNTSSLTLYSGVLMTAKELSSTDGRVRLNLPANTAIDMQGLTQLGAATESNPPAASDNSTLVRAYSFIPSGATFSPAATMTLRYETASLPAGAPQSSLYIAYWNGTSWQKLSSTVNTALREVSAPVAHFTIFAIRCPNLSAGTTTSASATSASANVTISANILGTTTSLVTVNGALTRAADLSSANGKMSISLADNTTLSLPGGSRQITVVQLASPPAAPAGVKLVEAYSFGPDNSTFNPAARVSMKYDPATLPTDVQESGLYLALLEGSNWTEAPCTVNTQLKTLTWQVSHFPTYALMGRVTAEPTAPAAPAAPAVPAAPASPTTPAETPPASPAAAGSGAPSGMAILILAVIIAGGLLIIVLVIVLLMRQRS